MCSCGYYDTAEIASFIGGVKWLLIFLVLGVQIIFAVIMGRVSQEKGHSFAGAFWGCFFFGAFGAVCVAALPDMVTRDIVRIVLKRENETKREFDYLKKEIAKLTHQIDELKKKNEE